MSEEAVSITPPHGQADGYQVERIALVQEEPVDPRRRIIDAHHHLWGEGQGLGGSPAYLHEHLLADMAGHYGRRECALRVARAACWEW